MTEDGGLVHGTRDHGTEDGVGSSRNRREGNRETRRVMVDRRDRRPRVLTADDSEDRDFGRINEDGRRMTDDIFALMAKERESGRAMITQTPINNYRAHTPVLEVGQLDSGPRNGCRSASRDVQGGLLPDFTQGLPGSGFLWTGGNQQDKEGILQCRPRNRFSSG